MVYCTRYHIRTRYVSRKPTSEVNLVTIQYIHPPHHGHTKVNIMVMNRWLTSLSFHVNQPSHSWDKAISKFDLETSRSRSWVWSKGKVIQSAQYLINLIPFHFTIRPTIPEMQLFWIWPWKIQGPGHEWGQRWRSYSSPSVQSMQFLFCFTLIRPTILEIGQKHLTLKKTRPKFWKTKVAKKNCPTKFIQNLVR